ncbi:MAG: hypothetical protein GY839_02775 [candidate division Zixibacteria bacterium]|nr:hypothetical protein [candidate division Zixibacteria bacterium]
MSRKEDVKLSKPEIHQMEKTRKTLLANLSANLDISIQENTYWEEVTCVGFNPQMVQLEAVVSVKRETGYSGGLCSDGSTEYVRFFVDWDDGAGFQDVGLTSFKVYDISEAPTGPQHPLKYMVYMPLDDYKHRKCCGTAVMPKIRAVLSWNQMPSLDPNATPHYGNTIDALIQIEPKNSMECLFKAGYLEKKSDLLEIIDFDAAIPTLKPKPVPWSKLVAGYRKADVPDHRLVYDAVYPMIKGGKELSLTSAQMDISLIEKFKVNMGEITDILLEKKANTTYEEIVCAGLNTASDILGAVIHVKKSTGYSGNLCQTGSKEYVAFWADWDNNGTFDSYLGTSSVEVFDIARKTSEGLYYSVMLPANFSKRLKNCKNPNIVRIRAVLSWAVPPSTTDPNDLNYWGNSLDIVVQIRPGRVSTELMDLIYDVGNVPIDNISSITYLANPSSGVLNPLNCNQPAMDRPFGGMVRIGGRIYNTGSPGTVRYKVEYTPHGLGNWLPVSNSVTFQLMHPNPFDPKYPKEIKTEASPDGWIPFDEDPTATPPILERTNLLAKWATGSLGGTYDLRLAYTKDYPLTLSSVIHYSDVVTIILDNTNYTVNPGIGGVVNTAYDLDLVIDGGDCHSYSQGDTIPGHLRALDKYFWKWRLELQPTTHTHGTQASPRCRSYGSLVDQGDANAPWSLDTTNLDKCGYTITLWAYDRTIVNSNGAIVHWNKDAVGFSVV